MRATHPPSVQKDCSTACTTLLVPVPLLPSYHPDPHHDNNGPNLWKYISEILQWNIFFIRVPVVMGSLHSNENPNYDTKTLIWNCALVSLHVQCPTSSQCWRLNLAVYALRTVLKNQSQYSLFPHQLLDFHEQLFNFVKFLCSLCLW